MKFFHYVIVFLFLFPDVALAHRFIMAAWIEGQEVCVTSAFSDGSAPYGATIEIFAVGGVEPLVVGKTDENGQYSCAIPKNTALRIRGDAGMGHQGEKIISKEEVAAAFAPPSPELAVKAENATVSSSEGGMPSPQTASGSAVLAMDSAELSRIVEAAVEKKLRPVVRQLATAEQHRGIDIRDIFSGLGYILGLVGLGTYMGYRQRKNRRK
ncbi:MAG: hypothetical protein CSA20_00025 [Deltaproteobacteria bacterium]|nr:MAG: hypothetical protein CSA20_00025 [Deltaproteobacteria bacterium]